MIALLAFLTLLVPFAIGVGVGVAVERKRAEDATRPVLPPTREAERGELGLPEQLDIVRQVIMAAEGRVLPELEAALKRLEIVQPTFPPTLPPRAPIVHSRLPSLTAQEWRAFWEDFNAVATDGARFVVCQRAFCGRHVPLLHHERVLQNFDFDGSVRRLRAKLRTLFDDCSGACEGRG